MSSDSPELRLLAGIAYGESYYKTNSYEEMAAIASVLVRQRDSRGYASMQAFVTAEPTYSYVVRDGNKRFAAIKKLSEENIRIKLDRLNFRSSATSEASTLERRTLEGCAMSYRAARNALEGGPDYSNGAYFWDGWDIKTNYARHSKVLVGIKITRPEHNVFDIPDHLVTVVKTRVRVESRSGRRTVTREEVGRYDHVYESTAGIGGTIFWRLNPDYVSLERAKPFK